MIHAIRETTAKQRPAPLPKNAQIALPSPSAKTASAASRSIPRANTALPRQIPITVTESSQLEAAETAALARDILAYKALQRSQASNAPGQTE